MKTTLTLCLTLLLTLWAVTTSSAQGVESQPDESAEDTEIGQIASDLFPEPEEPNDMISVLDSEGNSLITISSYAGNDESFDLMIGAWKINMKSTLKEPDKYDFRRTYGYLTLLTNLEVGFNNFTSPGYGLYGAEDKGFLDLNMGKSVSSQFSVIGVDIALDKARRLRFNTSLAFNFTTYTFKRNLTVATVDGVLRPQYFETKKKQSSLVTQSLRIPVLLQYDFKQDFWIAGGIYAEWIMDSYTIQRNPRDVYYRKYNINPLNMGATLKVGWGPIYVFGNTNLTPTFKSGQGPRTQSFAIGFGIF